MKILVIFGSSSDKRIYEPLLDELKNYDVDFFIASAHKAPNYLSKIIENVDSKYDLVIAGAGLAAHLPGVIASKTALPVIGIPIDVNYNGIDSLLSIIQMPPMVPVLSSGIDRYSEAARFAKNMAKTTTQINFTSRIGEKKFMPLIERFNIPHAFGEIKKDAINIVPVELGEVPKTVDALIIQVPNLEKSSSKDIEKLKVMTNIGLWVGLNRFDNAVIAAMQLMKMKTELQTLKKEIEDKFENPQN